MKTPLAAERRSGSPPASTDCNEAESTQRVVGDADPLLAIADALPTFPADEIVIAAESERRPGSPTNSCLARATASRSPIFRAGESLPGAA